MNVMIDLETLGTRAGSVILSIGAIEFDVDAGLGREFYAEVSQLTCGQVGLLRDGPTITWWQERCLENETLKEFLYRTTRGGEAIWTALSNLNAWLPQDPLVWGNGAAFDNAILKEAYRLCSVVPGWHFENDRCYRTLKNLAPEVTLERSGTHHHALDDARTQAEHAIRLLKSLASPKLDLAELQRLRKTSKY